MTLVTQWRIAIVWLTFVPLLRAVDLGLRIGRFSLVPAYMADTILALIELVLHSLVLSGLTSHRRWGHTLALIWIPIWAAWLSYNLYFENNPVLAVLWTPIFIGSATAFRFLLQPSILALFDIRGHFLQSAHRWLSPALMFGVLIVPLSYAVDFRFACSLWLATVIISATAGDVYG